MAERKLPKIGDRIPIGKIHISETNMRHGQPFPQDPEDETLLANVRARMRRKEKETITELISLRPEGDGYGVYKGGRRFQAMKLAGANELVVGEDSIVRDVSDEEAADASWIENLEFLRKGVDPITRAEKLAERQAFSGLTLRQLATRDGVGVSTYSEWLTMERLSPKMKEVVRNRQILYTDGLELAKMELGTELQDKLAEVAAKEGREAFKEEVAKLPTARRKRGIPPGIYEITRITWDTRHKPDMELYEKLTKLAEAKEMKVDEYSKWILKEHVKAA